MSDDDLDDEDGADVEPIKFGRALELEWDGAFWSGGLKLRSLGGGELNLEIESEDGTLPPAIRSGIAWLIANEAKIGPAAFAAIAKAYPKIRADFEAHDVKMPPDLDGGRMKRHVQTTALTVHDVVRGRLPYFGVEFHASWDTEHGLGLMMHGTRVVKLGGGDAALLVEYAEDDAKQAKKAKKPTKKKPAKRNSRTKRAGR
jgi:hypothetical protein